MDTKRPTVVTIAAILLVVLTLFVAGLGIAGQFGIGRGFGTRSFAGGQFRNRQFTPQGGGTFNGNPIGSLPNGQNNGQSNGGTTPNFTPNRQFGTGIASIFRLLRPVTIGLDIVLLVLAVVATIGLIRSRRWAATMAIVLSVLVILLAIPGFLRIFSAGVLIENLVRILLAVAVIVLLLLPKARQSYLPRPEEEVSE